MKKLALSVGLLCLSIMMVLVLTHQDYRVAALFGVFGGILTIAGIAGDRL